MRAAVQEVHDENSAHADGCIRYETSPASAIPASLANQHKPLKRKKIPAHKMREFYSIKNLGSFPFSVKD